ncbi:retrovirus-related pol polyprotein from transposon TNT 1-94, partial [Tanacetum coccineum]
MEANQAIKYAPQCGDLTVESLVFHNNNVLVIYQNFFRKLWCIAIAYDPNLPMNDSEVRPLKEFKIKFLVMNGKKPLTLDFRTFTESTGLNYYDGTYVSHPSAEAVKTELAKIVKNLILLDRTPVLKTAFPVAWRILFNFVIHEDDRIQELDENHGCKKWSLVAKHLAGRIGKQCQERWLL